MQTIKTYKDNSIERYKDNPTGFIQNLCYSHLAKGGMGGSIDLDDTHKIVHFITDIMKTEEDKRTLNIKGEK